MRHQLQTIVATTIILAVSCVPVGAQSAQHQWAKKRVSELLDDIKAKPSEAAWLLNSVSGVAVDFPEAAADVAVYLTHEYPEVRCSAARALLALGGPKASVKALLADADPDVRCEAGRALLEHGIDATDVRVLLSDTSPDVRLEIGCELLRTGERPAVLPLLRDKDPNVRAKIARAFLRDGLEPERAVHLLEDTSAHVRKLSLIHISEPTRPY